jgi:hypothetical protein
MTSERIDRAVEVINYAIKNQISITEASKQCGYADTYVKNVRAVVFDLYKNNAIEDELFNKFNEANDRYLHRGLGLETPKPKLSLSITGRRR